MAHTEADVPQEESTATALAETGPVVTRAPSYAPDHEAAPAADVARLDAVRALAVALSGARDQRECLTRTLRAARAALTADGASLWVAAGGTLACQLGDGAEAQRLVGLTLPSLAALAEGADGEHALSTALAAGGAAPLGALRVTRRGADAPPFGAADAAVLAAMAAVTGAALAALARTRAADRSGDVALLAAMSREIASTLDLDRVLRVAVNLVGRAIVFDRGALALYENGECDVRAVAGAETFDAQDPVLRDLAARGAWAAGTGEAFHLADRDDPGSDAERIFLQVFGPDLVAAEVSSALYLPLKDDEGVLGVLLLEATRPEFVSARERELASIFASQVTVAIRNAQLFRQVPLADALGAFNVRRKRLLALPHRRRAALAGTAAAALAALTLVRWPLRVVAETATFRPAGGAEARALVGGVVERVLVREGEAVARGAPLAQLRDAELRAERDAALADAEADERNAAASASRGDAAGERTLRARAAAGRRDAALLEEQRRFTVVRAPVDGVVLTPRPEQRVGARAEAGDAVLLVGRTDSLELDLTVHQRDVARVRPGQRVRLRVDAMPERTFVGRVVAVGLLPTDSSPPESRGADATFPVRAVVANPRGLLRAGMAARARVLTDPASLAGRLLRQPLRVGRTLWWRMWG